MLRASSLGFGVGFLDKVTVKSFNRFIGDGILQKPKILPLNQDLFRYPVLAEVL
jgi:hypothetical protein